ncbi:DUF3667 domain-containing protein [Neolewinella agarilytica]|uniref:DUF3667 domain-containing protein n=2 Tax=Neolewinella agarilytica TaxID=478744 RepID=A0A1H8YWY7_9BACT|nr:DUF3667 domain-containing protein [Neolewinella agarilytica]SEP56689.1 Protein of unknown function [Neolewinella agarilytica]
MENTTCLNCQTAFSGHFCPNCGQKASTRRYSWSYVFSKDFLSDIFNFDRGFLHTLRDLSYRPGHLVNDYLQGKRKTYFNAVGFLLIVLAIEALLWSLSQNSVAELMLDNFNAQLRDQPDPGITLEDVEIMLRNQKIIFLLTVPLAAFFSWLVLKRLLYNFLEHCIAIIFLLAMNTMLGFSAGLLGLLPISMDTFKLIYAPISLIVIAFDFLLIWQFSQKADYSLGGRIWRTALTFILVITVIAGSLQFAMGISKGYRDAGKSVPVESSE